jgi:hypothetical protein
MWRNACSRHSPNSRPRAALCLLRCWWTSARSRTMALRPGRTLHGEVLAARAAAHFFGDVARCCSRHSRNLRSRAAICRSRCWSTSASSQAMALPPGRTLNGAGKTPRFTASSICVRPMLVFALTAGIRRARWGVVIISLQNFPATAGLKRICMRPISGVPLQIRRSAGENQRGPGRAFFMIFWTSSAIIL